ncbi:HK97 gp10 family phage protein [Aminipila terrae]|uniref:HK97 gp10 family phage protein n=1 Tax=Aminipila terrae TaxID=2697030 RepID=A0A6P1MQ55_9FIRM|nr:HK97 gp10 family phage protein [Aminipila terrae]QHI73786.1 HK97 gp10 family phage protein [Aminipila terrae]
MDTLDDLSKDLISAALTLNKGNHAKQFLRKEGTDLKKVTLSEAKSKIRKRTGGLFKSIKKGKAYKYNGDLAIRVYAGKPGHLLNNGHRIVDKNGTEHGFKEGVHFLESAESKFEGTFETDTLKWIDGLLDNCGL